MEPQGAAADPETHVLAFVQTEPTTKALVPAAFHDVVVVGVVKASFGLWQDVVNVEPPRFSDELRPADAQFSQDVFQDASLAILQEPLPCIPCLKLAAPLLLVILYQPRVIGQV